LSEKEPKHTISKIDTFNEDREKISSFITKDMQIAGGTDIDWVIERKNGFIVLETKTIFEKQISIKKGQMIALTSIYKKLNSSGKCKFFVVGLESNFDFSNEQSNVYYFEMEAWVFNTIKSDNDTRYGVYRFWIKDMKLVSLRKFREILDKYWNDYGKSFD